jgi:hypothetical protein
VDNGNIVLGADVAFEGRGNLSVSSVGRWYPLKVALSVEIEEQIVPSSCGSPNTSRDSVATVAMVTAASDPLSFMEKDSYYTFC